MTPIRILVVDDDPGYAELVSRMIDPVKKAFPGSAITIVGSLGQAIVELDRMPGYHVTFLDLTFPENSMQQTLDCLDAIENKSAVVIVTGQPEHRVREIIGERKTPVIVKQPMLYRHAETLMQAMLDAISFSTATRNHRWAKIEENVQIMRNVIQSHATQT